MCYRKFWILFGANVLSASFGVFMSAAFKQYGSSNIDDDVALSVIGALTGVGNGLSRFIWASCMDYFGFINVYRCLLSF